MAKKKHRLLVPADGIHSIVARRITSTSELDDIADEWDTEGPHTLGRVVMRDNDPRIWIFQGTGDVEVWREIASAETLSDLQTNFYSYTNPGGVLNGLEDRLAALEPGGSSPSATGWQTLIDASLAEYDYPIDTSEANQVLTYAGLGFYTHDWAGKIAAAGASDGLGVRLQLLPTGEDNYWWAAPNASGNNSPGPGLFFPFRQFADYRADSKIAVQVAFDGSNLIQGNALNVAIVYASALDGTTGEVTLDRDGSVCHEFQLVTVGSAELQGWYSVVYEGGAGGSTTQQLIGGSVADPANMRAIGVIRNPGGAAHTIAVAHGDTTTYQLPPLAQWQRWVECAAGASARRLSPSEPGPQWGFSISLAHNDGAGADVRIKRIRVQQSIP